MSHQKYKIPGLAVVEPHVPIATNRVAVHLGGRRYPFVEEVATLPGGLAELPARIGRSLELEPTDKPGLFRQYAELFGLLEHLESQFNKLMLAVAKAGGFSEPIRMTGLLPIPAPRAEWYMLPVERIFAEMSAALPLVARHYAERMVAALDEGVRKQHVGLIEWMGSDACRYHYFEFKDETRVLDERTTQDHRVDGRRHTVTTSTERDKERVRSITRHVHDLIEAKRVPVAKWAEWSRIPPRPKRVARIVPDWMPAEHVDGQQIRDMRIEREVSREHWTESDTVVRHWVEPESPPRIVETPRYRYDPAIVVGHYVLVGWDEDEPKGDRAPSSDPLACWGCGGRRKVGSRERPDAPCPDCNGTGMQVSQSSRM